MLTNSTQPSSTPIVDTILELMEARVQFGSDDHDPWSKVKQYFTDNAENQNLKAVTPEEWSKPLNYAIDCQSPDMAAIFIDRGAVLSKERREGMPEWATRHGSVDLLKVLIKKDVNLDVMVGGITTLMWAIHYQSNADKSTNHRYFEMVTLIVPKVDVNAKDRYGDTALHDAVRCKNQDNSNKIVKLLLDKGANVDAKNTKGETALLLAIKEGKTQLIDMLVNAGAACYEKELFATVFKGKTGILSKLKIENINAQQSGQSILHYAVTMRHATIVAELIDLGANVNFKNFWGDTPLDIAQQYNFTEIIPLLAHTPKRWAINKWSLALGLTAAAVIAVVAVPWVAVCVGAVTFGFGKACFARLNKTIDAQVVVTKKTIETGLQPARSKSPVVVSGPRTNNPGPGSSSVTPTEGYLSGPT